MEERTLPTDVERVAPARVPPSGGSSTARIPTEPPEGGTLAGELLLYRRDFLRACVRYPLLAGLTILGTVLVLRKGDPDFAETCLKQRVCQSCGSFHDCALPRAAMARKGQA